MATELNMDKEELLNGINEIGEWICGVSKVYDETPEDEENRHIKYFYEVLDELRKVIEEKKNV